MKTIAFINQKGGVGKTTSATSVAQILASEFNKRVIICDLDSQANTTVLLGNVDVLQYIDSLFNDIPIDKNKVGLSLEDLLLDTSGSVNIHDTIRHTKYKNLDIIQTFLTQDIAESRLKDDIMSPQQFRLLNHFKTIQNEYDYCILDCSPAVNITNINGLSMADKVYIPLTVDAFSLAGCAVVKKTIEQVSIYNPKLQFGGVFFTRFSKHKKVSRAALSMVKKYLPGYVIPYNIPVSKLLEENTYMGQALLEYDSSKKKTNVTKAYIDLTKYIIADLEK